MISRGSIQWFEPDPVRGSEQSGRRPALVVSREPINRAGRVVIVIPLTTFRGQRLYPSDVLVRAPEGGLRQDSVVVCLQVRAVDVQRLGPALGTLNRATMAQVARGLYQVLDLEADLDPLDGLA